MAGGGTSPSCSDSAAAAFPPPTVAATAGGEASSLAAGGGHPDTAAGPSSSGGTVGCLCARWSSTPTQPCNGERPAACRRPAGQPRHRPGEQGGSGVLRRRHPPTPPQGRQGAPFLPSPAPTGTARAQLVTLVLHKRQPSRGGAAVGTGTGHRASPPSTAVPRRVRRSLRHRVASLPLRCSPRT